MTRTALHARRLYLSHRSDIAGAITLAALIAAAIWAPGPVAALLGAM